LLTKLRKVVANKILYPIAKKLASIGLSPNVITVIGLLFSILYLASMYVEKIELAVFFILTSGVMDALDGAVAKVTGKTTKLGAFLDSTIDRIEDSIFILGLSFLRFESLLIYIFLALSLMISYMRAKGESLGLKLEGVGVMERSERIIAIFLIVTASSFSHNLAYFILYATIALSLITFIQRFFFITHSLTLKDQNT